MKKEQAPDIRGHMVLTINKHITKFHPWSILQSNHKSTSTQYNNGTNTTLECNLPVTSGLFLGTLL